VDAGAGVAAVPDAAADQLLGAPGGAGIRAPLAVHNDGRRAGDAPGDDLLVGAFHFKIDRERIGRRHELVRLGAELGVELRHVLDLGQVFLGLRTLGSHVVGRERTIGAPDGLEHRIVRLRVVEAQRLGGKVGALEHRPVLVGVP